AALAQAGKTFPLTWDGPTSFSSDFFSPHDCQADSPGDSTERSFRCGHAGKGNEARQERRPAAADAQRLHVSHALSDSAARTVYDAGSLRDGAHRGTFHQISPPGSRGS